MKKSTAFTLFTLLLFGIILVQAIELDSQRQDSANARRDALAASILAGQQTYALMRSEQAIDQCHDDTKALSFIGNAAAAELQTVTRQRDDARRHACTQL